jgi:hypothetical protein
MTVAYHGHTIQLRPGSLTERWARPARPAGPPLRAGEHPLLRESARHDDAQYVATEKAVYYRANREQAWQRIAWVDIARVEQSRATGALTLHGWPGGHRDPTRLMVGARSRLPAFTQERITACQLLVRRIDIADDTTVVITAIREPGTDQTKWTVHVNRVWDQDPTLTALIDRALHETQALAGC